MPIASDGFIGCAHDGRTYREVGLFHSILSTDNWPNCDLADKSAAKMAILCEGRTLVGRCLGRKARFVY